MDFIDMLKMLLNSQGFDGKKLIQKLRILFRHMNWWLASR